MANPLTLTVKVDASEAQAVIDKAIAFNYQSEAQQTKSPQFHGNLVSKQVFINRLIDVIRACQDLDVMKKALFYGKANPVLASANPNSFTANNLKLFNLGESQDAVDILHGIIGKATEAGELCEALFAAVVHNEPFDRTNCVEEIGDGMWYDAIVLNAIGSNFGAAQRINIDKLRARFPDRFTEYDAQNRDLIKERSILEGKKTAFDTLPDDYEVN